jgi:hypothetical protein
VVSPPQVTRRVADDHREQARRVRGPSAQLSDIRPSQERVKRVLNDVQSVSRAHTLAASDSGEPAGVIAREPGDPVATTAMLMRTGRRRHADHGSGGDAARHYNEEWMKGRRSIRHDSYMFYLAQNLLCGFRTVGAVTTKPEELTMPRKQRFKPSRKPKPNPSNEDATTGRQESSSPAHNENAPPRESLSPRPLESVAVEGT